MDFFETVTAKSSAHMTDVDQMSFRVHTDE